MSGENKTLAARERADSLSFGTIQTLLRFESPRDLCRDFPNAGSKGGSRFRGAVVGSGAARSPLQPALRGRPPVFGVFSPRSHLCARSRLLRRTRGCGRAVAVPCPVSPGHGHAWQTPRQRGTLRSGHMRGRGRRSGVSPRFLRQRLCLPGGELPEQLAALARCVGARAVINRNAGI